MMICGHVMHMMLYMLYASLCVCAIVCAYMDSQSMADFSPQFGVPNQGVSHLHKNNSFTSLWDSLGVVCMFSS